MNKIFKDMLSEGWLIIYMDNMLIFSRNAETHRIRTHQVIQRLQEFDLFLKADKCSFNKSKVDYLGFIVSKDKLEMDPAKLQGIKDWPNLQKPKHVQQFLGFTGFYRQFI